MYHQTVLYAHDDQRIHGADGRPRHLLRTSAARRGHAAAHRPARCAWDPRDTCRLGRHRRRLARCDLVLVRSCLDYARRRREFLEWAARVPRLANPAPMLRWNTDKRYLSDLAAPRYSSCANRVAATRTSVVTSRARCLGAQAGGEPGQSRHRSLSTWRIQENAVCLPSTCVGCTTTVAS
jgi:hypothetical protein